MQTYDYFNSLIMHSFARPIKGIEQINEQNLFILLDDGTCIVFDMKQMRILSETKYPELSFATHSSKFSIRNDKTNEIKDLIMTQHKLGYLMILMIDNNTNQTIILQQNNLADYTGFMKILPNEELFSYQNNYIQQRNILNNSCFIYVPNRKECMIDKINLLNGEVLAQFQFYQDKLVDTISSMKKILIQTSDNSNQDIHLLLLGYEGLYFSIIQINDKEQSMKELLKRTKIIESKEEMPYIFDFQVSITIKEHQQTNQEEDMMKHSKNEIDNNNNNNKNKNTINDDIIMTIYIGSSVCELNILKYNLRTNNIISQKSISLNYITPQIGISNILIDSKSIFLTTLDRQIKIISQNKYKEICSFQYHNNSINAILLISSIQESQKLNKSQTQHQHHNNNIKENNILDNEEKILIDKNIQNKEIKKTIYLISISEDCKLAITDLNKLRKKK